MIPKHPNVLFLTIDALRTDRMSLHGYSRPTTPNIDRLAEKAVVCEENISNTSFTHPSLPSFLTSSRPLSFGGYDQGVHGRPPTLFKAFAEAGYETAMISTFPWVNRFYGYDKGVHREHLLFSINALVGVTAQIMASPLAAYLENSLAREQVTERIGPLIAKLFDDLDQYCILRDEQAPLDRLDMADERILREGYDHRRVRKIIARHRREFEGDAAAYIDQHLTYVPKAHQWIAAEWRLARRPGVLAEMSARRFGARLLGKRASLLTEHHSKRYVDGRALANRVIHCLETRDPSRPFLIWTHFFDTHVPYCAGAGIGWQKKTGDYLAALGYSRTIDPAIALAGKPTTDEQWSAWSALYDAAIRYVDEQVGRILAALERLGILDETLIVITSDHGEELGEHGDISHHFRLYDHNLRVPMIFKGPDVEGRRNASLTSLLDLVPSIAHFADIPADPAWEGMAVSDPAVAERSHVMAESFHGGSCLFEHRTPYIAVRTHRYKYLWKEYRDPLDTFSAEGLELFDHREDPLEQNNLYRPDHPALAELNPVVAERLAEIPEIAGERIVTAFGSVGEDALVKIRGVGGPKEEKALG